MFVLRRRHVRIHQADPAPSIDGILVGKPWRNAGHYVVRRPGIIAALEVTVESEGVEVWVPRERVLFLEVFK